MKRFKNIPYSIEVEVTKDLQEKASHGSFDMPMAIYIDEFRKYSAPVIQHHWHNEIQLAYILNGEAEYEIYGEKILMKEGEGLFINSNIIHMSTSPYPEKTQMITVLFNTSIFSGINQVEIEKDCILPIITCKSLSHILFYDKTPYHRFVLKKIKALINSEEKREKGYKLEQKNILGEIWLAIIRNSTELIVSDNRAISFDDIRIKTMLMFIDENYNKNISLKEIASSAGLSKSECCRCFKRTIRMSPFEYLIQKRIFSAASLISSTDMPMSYISQISGFNEPSYFYKTFKSIMNMTPTEFRERSKN